GEERLAVLPEALMGVHAGAVILIDGLGHEGNRLAVLLSYVAHHVLVDHHAVGRDDKRLEALVDLTLAAGRHLVVVTFDFHSHLLHGEHHFSAEVLIMVSGGDREVAFLVAWTITQVVLLAAGIQTALRGTDDVVAVLLRRVNAHIVEHE